MALSDIRVPFTLDATGLPAKAVGDEAIVGMIRLLLTTRLGEIEGFTGFGTDLWRGIFESTPVASSLVMAELSEALAVWLPFVTLTRVAPSVDADGKLYIDIAYDYESTLREATLALGG